MLAALIMTAALVIDGGGTLVRFRQLQNAADAGATAASHRFTSTQGCSGTYGPRGPVVAAARTAVRDHIAEFPTSRITVSCPAGYDDYAVKVVLVDTGQATFMRLMNPGGLRMTATATAVNRAVGSSVQHAIMTLNPGEPRWTLNSGCPSLRVEGSARLSVFAPIHVNSGCRASDGGAATTIGSASVVVKNGQLTAVGDASGNISPTPLTGLSAQPDPYAGIAPPARSRLPVQSNARLLVSGTRVLQPGIYRGGVEVQGTALLQPGIYIIEGGGINASGGGIILAVDAGVTSSSPSTWESDCNPLMCGVLIYNSGGGQMESLDFSGNGSVKLRGYRSGADVLGLAVADYEGIAIWQDRLPSPTSNRAQPEMYLHGNPGHDLYGLVYLPSARLTIVGASNYSMAVALVVWELAVIGSADVTLRNDTSAFPERFDYGLVE